MTGTGTTAGSGGTIQNTTGDGVKLTDTQDVSLSNMTISDNAGSGINGLRVNGVTLTKLTLNSNADTQAEAGSCSTNLPATPRTSPPSAT